MVQIVLIGVAALMALVIALAHIFAEGAKGQLRARLMAFLVLGPIIAVLAGAGVLHDRVPLELSWVFGSDTVSMGLVGIVTALCLLVAAFDALLISRVDTALTRYAFMVLGMGCFVLAGAELHRLDQLMFGLSSLQSLNLVYSAIGFALIALSAVSVLAPTRKWLERRRGQLILRDIHAFISWLQTSRCALVFTLATAVLLQHESFEEYSELMLAMTLMMFLVAYVREWNARGLPLSPAE